MNKNKKNLVSIIIPSFNRKDDLDRCINSIYLQTYKLFEIIVVDDGSLDDTELHIKNVFPNIKFFSNSRNRGPNYCRNLGVSKSIGEFILILDSDVELLNRKQIKNMVKIILSEQNIGEIGGYYSENNQSIMGCGIKRSHVFDKKQSITINNFNFSICEWVASNNLFMRKRLFYEMGGFDEKALGGETELELGLLLHLKGYKNLISPDIAVKHNQSLKERDNIGVQLNQNKNKHFVREKWRYRNRLKFFIKHRLLIKRKVLFLNNLLKLDKIISEPISILAFIKQQFFGLKKQNSINFKSTKEKNIFLRKKIENYFILLFLIINTTAWNLFHLQKTLNSRKNKQ